MGQTIEAVRWGEACDKGVLTLATGKPFYFEIALNLARSFVFWHRGSAIRFFIATDLEIELPRDLAGVSLLKFQPGELGKGFSAKLQLDRMAPAGKTLFVDADCLCVGSLEPVFARFSGRPVSVVGGSISSGDWFGDVASVCARIGVAELPKYNGGIYYLERGGASETVYARARDLEKDYDDLGLARLRGQPNDELLMAMAMALHGLKAIPDDSTIMSDPQACPGGLGVDVLMGWSRLVNPPPPDRRHQAWYPFVVVHPVVVHFLGDNTSSWQYQAEVYKLALVSRYSIPVSIAWTSVFLFYQIPARCMQRLKDLLRPLYRWLFGVREVKPSKRI